MSTEEGREMAERFGVKFVETSAKDCKNVEEAFFTMSREIKNIVVVTEPKKRLGTNDGKRITAKDTKKIGKQKKGTCC